MKCPDCGLEVHGEAFDDHRGDEMCTFMQVRTERLKKLARAGSTHPTQAKAGVEFTFIAHNFEHDAMGHGPGVGYVRCAPAWAVWLAECTVLNADMRIVALEHCLEHGAARQAVESAMRLNVFGKSARGKQGKKSSKNRPAILRFFQDLMLVTGDAEDED